MKLFKSLLVAPATLGLLAPMSVTANELNLSDVSDYSSSEEVQNITEFSPQELAVTNSRVDGLEARINDFEAGSFSETTTASFSADFYIGQFDDDDQTDDDSIAATYSFQIDLNTSFTGEDSLDISLDAGNSTAAIDGTSEFDGNITGDNLQVDGVSYTFPVGEKATFIVGDNTDGSALFTKACVYGGPSNYLDDCGNVNAAIEEGGATFGASYDFGSGFTAAFGYQGTNSSLATDEGVDSYAFNGAYTGDNYGISLTYGVVESTDAAGATDGEEDTYMAYQAYYTPDIDGFPSISIGFETGDLGGEASTADTQESFFLGFTWDEVGPGSLGIATGHSNTVESTNSEVYQTEIYYDYPVNDGMTITPLIFTRENIVADRDDTTGLMVKTAFRF